MIFYYPWMKTRFCNHQRGPGPAAAPRPPAWRKSRARGVRQMTARPCPAPPWRRPGHARTRRRRRRRHRRRRRRRRRAVPGWTRAGPRRCLRTLSLPPFLSLSLSPSLTGTAPRSDLRLSSGGRAAAAARPRRGGAAAPSPPCVSRTEGE